MYRFHKQLLRGIFGLCVFFLAGVAYAKVPVEYIANGKIQSHLDKIQELFLQIDADSQIGTQVKNNVFVDVYNSINALVSYLPQEYKFKIIYTKCLSLSKQLSMGYDYDSFGSFMKNCHAPFSTVLSTIESRYTVKTSANTYPQSGPAPLTVTFDARGSVDPSNETIPSNNYYRYYRDVNGEDRVIGQGPTVKHTFSEAGSYKVHLTVRSSNHVSKGIFDGNTTLTVQVTPKSAQINIRANNFLLERNTKTKFGTQEAQKGILFDASATIPMGGREILSHSWRITGPDTNITKSLEGSPTYLKVPLNENGEYTVTLTTSDNEKNIISESYSIIITDPVAIIRPTPEKGDTSTTFSFSANGSYSVLSNLKLYTWDFFDEQGVKIDTFQGKEVKKQFKKPGNYTIKLTVEDALGRTNIATEQLFVESSDPIAQFSSTPVADWKNPSEFILDASLSSDIDVLNKFDELSYEWSASDSQNTILTDPKSIRTKVQFNTVGTHTITLIVKDKYGKVGEISKDFNIISILRPKISLSAKAITWGEYINLVVTSNQDILSYQWNFGDGDERYVQTNIIKHRYNRVGNYTVKLKVYGKDNMENEVYTTVFVGDKDKPIPAYNVYSKNAELLYPRDICIEQKDGENIQYDAYQIDRYQDFTINAGESVNSRGAKNDLKFFFKVIDENIYINGNNFKYNWKKLGCRFVDFTVEDSKLGKTTTTRIWFKIYNSLPTLNNLQLFFPQYGNQMGIGFNQNTVKDIFTASFDPLIVKVSAENPHDKDGYISYYKRYYYRKDDPSKYIEIKITPSTVPYSYFTLPRIPGEFMFGVTMYDNNDGFRKSQDIIGNGPVVVFPPDTNTPDVPIVTVKNDKTFIEVGDEVTFDVISRIISDKPDFDTSRVIRYDFDGDGAWDLTTKDDHVKYVYEKDGVFTPIIEVSYRGYYTEAYSPEITVNKGLKPILLYNTYGDLAIFRSENIGKVIASDICFDLIDCKQNRDSEYLHTGVEKEYFDITYPKVGKYLVNMKVKDAFANVADKTWELKLTPIDTGEKLHILAIPEISKTPEGYEVLVGKNLGNKVLYYVKYNGDGECYVDVDITDTVKSDFQCNELVMQKYTPSYTSTHGKVYYQLGDKMVTKDIIVSYLDYSVNLDLKVRDALKIIDEVVSNLDTQKESQKFLKEQLIQIQKDIINSNKTQSNIAMLYEYLQTNKNLDLSQIDTEKLHKVMTLLAVDDTVASLGGTEYEKAKIEILSLTPEQLKKDVEILFARLENVEEGNAELTYRKGAIEKIGQFFVEKIAKDPSAQKDTEITLDDMNLIIKPNLCKIADYYNIEAKSCATLTDKGEEVLSKNLDVSTSGFPGWLKVLLIILGIVVGGFIVMIIVFAVKARMRDGEQSG